VQHTPGASAVVDLCRRRRCATATLVMSLTGRMNSPQEQRTEKPESRLARVRTRFEFSGDFLGFPACSPKWPK